MRNYLQVESNIRTGRLDQQPSYLHLPNFLPYRLSILSNKISNGIARTYEKRFGLSVQEWRVMAVVGAEPGLSAREVAERTAMDKVAVSRAVNRLIKHGHIARGFAEDDRRRSILRLTKAGTSIYRKIVPLALEYESALLAHLTSKDRNLLDRILEKLRQAEETAHPVG